jgi:hypothetical protein
MNNFDSILHDGFTLRGDNQRKLAEELAEKGFCSVVERELIECNQCESEVAPEEITAPNHECPECECSVEMRNCGEIDRLAIKIKKPDTYRGIRIYCKEATGMPYSGKNSVIYRREREGAQQDEKIEYRFELKDDNKEVKYTAQVLFDPPSDTIIRTMRLRGDSVPSILIGDATQAMDKLNNFDIPNITAGELADADHDSVVDFLEQGTQEYQRSHIKLNAETAFDWCTDREQLIAISDDEFEYLVQAILCELLIPSKLFGRENVGSEVPDGIIGFKKDNQKYSFMWDAKYIKMSDSDSNELDKSPYVPLLPGDTHSLGASEYRKIADHARMYQSEQDIELDGVILFSPAIPEEQLSRVQNKINQICGSLWSGNVILFTLDALLGLLDGENKNRGDVQHKQNRFIRLLVDYLTNRNVHNDPELAESDQVIKFDHDDVDSLFDELSSMSPEQTVPDYEVFVSRR